MYDYEINNYYYMYYFMFFDFRLRRKFYEK